MSDETMLLTIPIPKFRQPTQLTAMMLQYRKGLQVKILANLQPIIVNADATPESILEQVEAELGGLVELTPVHTLGCFFLECD